LKPSSFIDLFFSIQKLKTVMSETFDFITIAQWAGIATIGFAVLAVLGFILQWGVRFRLVGVTGFMLVLTAGIFALSLGLYSVPVVPGAVRYSTVYDTGANQVVIAVPPQITETELEATLRQAANNLFSYGRLGGRDEEMTIRARTVLHPEPGVAQPLYIGQVQRSLSHREDDQMSIEIYRDKLAQLPKSPA
jgi:hypothetical protein